MIKAKTKPKGKSASKFDFGKSYAELEKIVIWFEDDQVDLDEALGKFERGLELAQACQAKLKEVENRVIKIKEKFGA